jgi:septal ring factor EnvC (AmiA/AmiB activator)
MPDTSDSLLDKLKIWAFPLLLGGLNILLTRQINEAASEIKETRKDIIELSTTVKLETLERQYLTQRVTNLETAKQEAGATHKEHEARLYSLEQRAALYDEYMNSHKNR